MVAKRVGVPLTIARVRNADYLDSSQAVSTELTGIDYVIQPEAAVAEEIGKLTDFPGALEVESFAGGQVRMLEIQVDEKSPGAGKAIAEMGLPREVLVTGVLRGDTITIPRGDTVLKSGDRVFLAGQPAAVRAAAGSLSLKVRAPKTAILLGCGEIGLRAARVLEERGIRLKIFEKDYERAVAAASALNKALVLHDEGLSENILISEGIEDVDMFIATTGDDRLNILASLQAKRLGAERTISIVERAEFSDILQTMGIDVAISPRRLTGSAVLRFVRTGEVVSAALLDKSAGEVLELVVAANSPIAGLSLRECRFPADAILGVLVRGDEVHIAGGDSVPAAGDIAIVFASTESVPAVEKLFAPR
jgi:trk system potassium uptake protein TrkA